MKKILATLGFEPTIFSSEDQSDTDCAIGDVRAWLCYKWHLYICDITTEAY